MTISYITLYSSVMIAVQTIGPLNYNLAECEAYAAMRFFAGLPPGVVAYRCVESVPETRGRRPSAT